MTRALRTGGACVAAMLLAWGCGIFAEPDRSLIPPFTGAGGSGGAGGAGGSIVPDCTAPADCPGDDADCIARTCEGGVCRIARTPAGAPCDDTGGIVCDGDGRCVACLSDDDCDGDSTCDLPTHTCKPPQCTNGIEDGDETDVDCGGATCRDACGLGQKCIFYTDCLSHFCDGGFCSSCFIDDHCQLTDYCEGNQCVPKQANGAVCTRDLQCLSLRCVDGVCCSGTCAGPCQSCALPGSEGICDFYPAGVDPDDDCKGDDVCAAAGDCECGNGNLAPAEDCDDGAQDSYDGCSALCDDEAPHLFVSEFVNRPAGAEYIEIYNPTASAVDLTDIHLSNVTGYYTLSEGLPTVAAGEFLVQFPAGASIAAGSFVTVSLESATAFQNVYGFAPDFDLDPGDGGAPAMLGAATVSSQLASSDLIVLFQWNGATDLVTDVDYLLIGAPIKAVDKTNITVGASSYLPDTPAASQQGTLSPIADGISVIRCDTGESTETKTGGNGTSGHDETSENAAFAFIGSTPTPGAPPAAGVCP